MPRFANVHTITITLVLALTAILFCLLPQAVGAGEAANGTFYQWTDSDGVIFATDDPENIPPKYQAEARQRTFSEIGDQRLTPVVVPGSEYRKGLESSLNRARFIRGTSAAVNPNRLNDCTGPVEVRSSRRQFDGFSRQVFIVIDECGREVSVTPFYPDLRINR